MSELIIRKIPFEFEGVDFVWNPVNPHFAVSMNVLSFYAPALERYFVKVMVQAEALIECSEIRELARQFRLQEGQHSKSHQAHLAALIKQYPGLKQLSVDLNAMMDELLEKYSLPFHLAFMAELEATFTPLFKVMIDHRHLLFADGDSRVASLLLWHFCEEVEHRTAAVVIYDAIVKRHGYRVRQIPTLYRFHVRMTQSVLAAFKQYVPGLPEDYLNIVKGYRCIPVRAFVAMSYQLLYSQLPWYDHESQPLPRWSHKWFDHYERGDDMRHIYGVRQQGK